MRIHWLKDESGQKLYRFWSDERYVTAPLTLQQLRETRFKQIICCLVAKELLSSEDEFLRLKTLEEERENWADEKDAVDHDLETPLNAAARVALACTDLAVDLISSGIAHQQEAVRALALRMNPEERNCVTLIREAMGYETDELAVIAAIRILALEGTLGALSVEAKFAAIRDVGKKDQEEEG